MTKDEMAAIANELVEKERKVWEGGNSEHNGVVESAMEKEPTVTDTARKEWNDRWSHEIRKDKERTRKRRKTPKAPTEEALVQIVVPAPLKWAFFLLCLCGFDEGMREAFEDNLWDKWEVALIAEDASKAKRAFYWEVNRMLLPRIWKRALSVRRKKSRD